MKYDVKYITVLRLCSEQNVQVQSPPNFQGSLGVTQDLFLLLQNHLSETYKKLHGLSPRANYTYRATAACRRSDCQLFADRGCHVVSVTEPHGRILGFLDRSRYFSIK
jgi:hypothetical protein